MSSEGAYQEEDSDFDLIDSDQTLTADEKEVFRLLSRSFLESRTIDKFKSTWNEQKKRQREALSYSLIEEAEAKLLDPEVIPREYWYRFFITKLVLFV